MVRPITHCVSAGSRRRFLRMSAAGMLIPALPACSGSEDSAIRFTDTIAWGRQAIRTHMRSAPDAAAVSVALLWQDQIVWQEAFGRASINDARPATIHTRFNIGSVSKVLAGLTGAMLHDRGVIDLDAPITRYLPQFTMLGQASQRITSRQLLSHSSGLPGTNWRGIFAFEPYADYAADTEAGLANFHAKHIPGEMAVYCNDGFTLFERVVLAATGLTYPDYVHQNILAPLGMDHSGYLVSRPESGDFAYPVSDGQQYGLEFVNAYATGGLNTTPGDMMKLARLFIGRGNSDGKQLVSPEAIADMGGEQNAHAAVNPSPEWRWGLGWDTVRQPTLDAAGILAWEKNGGTAFFQSEFFVLPDVGMALLITGGLGYEPLTLAEEILLRALQEARQVKVAPAPVDTAAPPALTPPSTMNELIGIYGSVNFPIKVEVASGGALQLSRWLMDAWRPIIDGNSGRYTLRADGWWWSDNNSLPSYRFDVAELTEGDQTVQYRYLISRSTRGAGYHFVTMPVGQKLEPRDPLSSAWQARLGTQWRFANDISGSVAEALGGESVPLGSLPDLPGYLLWDGRQLLTPFNGNRARMSVKVPVSDGRDLDEIEISADARGPLLRIGSRIYRPA